MKVYRTIVIIITAIVGVSITIMCLSGPHIQAAIYEPVTEEYYDLLKENALNVAKTLDKNVITDETLTANFYINENELVVEITSMKAEITAKIPVSNHSLNIENGIIISKAIPEFANIEYVENSKLQPVSFYIIMSIFAGLIVSIEVYVLFFEFWKQFSRTKIK